MQFGIIRQNRLLWNDDFRVISWNKGVFIITYYRYKVYSHLNSKMEILIFFFSLSHFSNPQNGNFDLFFHFQLTFSFQNGNFDLFSILNSLFLLKIEISAVFSILNSFFLLKMEILTLFYILNSLFLPKMEISAVFSILNSLFLPKMEILTVFSILLNKKSGKLWADSAKSILSHSLFPDFWLYNKFGTWKNSSPGLIIFLYI